MNKQLLASLCNANGISGDEGAVRDIIIANIKDSGAEYSVDSMGNLIVFKKGKKTPDKMLLISAHMDEVGFIVTNITSGGYLKFDEVGGIDRRVIMGKSVTVGKNVSGVVCAAPMHLLSAEQRDSVPKIDSMYIDIGAASKEEALQYVSLGDSIQFDCDFKWENDIITGKALDDRAGCAIMIEIINSDLEYDTYFSFVVQEEVGLRGAKCAAYTVEPDFAIVVEATTAADIPNVADEKKVCFVGNGAVVSFMDRRTIYDKELVASAMKCASDNVKVQFKQAVAGGNDAGAIQTSKSGVRTLAVSLPCRYLHSPCGMISAQDLSSVQQVVAQMANKILSNSL
ncbi:MAG: M42 family peptidase [Acutalibacteraceae bacterium]|nr:M42 family peptidase [Acutalibacteraceae bacterium]